MATGTSVFLLAIGAILTFAIDATVAGVDLDAVGVILMIAGLVGLVVSLFYADRIGASPTTEHRVVEERTTERNHV